MDSTLRFSTGHNLLNHFQRILRVMLPAKIFNSIVDISGSLVKVLKKIKNVFRVVKRSPKHKDKIICLNQEVFNQIIRSSQNAFAVTKSIK